MFMRAKSVRARWMRARRKSGWTAVPLWSGRLQRVALYTVNFARKFMSSKMRPLAVMRYSFSFFTYSSFFVFLADFLACPCLFSSFVASDTNDVD